MKNFWQSTGPPAWARSVGASAHQVGDNNSNFNFFPFTATAGSKGVTP
jgi:hypothetical protein